MFWLHSVYLIKLEIFAHYLGNKKTVYIKYNLADVTLYEIM